jgi:hypothetical protein
MTMDVTPDDEHRPPRPWPRRVRIAVALLRIATGVSIGLVALFCFAVSLIPMLLEPRRWRCKRLQKSQATKNPALAGFLFRPGAQERTRTSTVLPAST